MEMSKTNLIIEVSKNLSLTEKEVKNVIDLYEEHVKKTIMDFENARAKDKEFGTFKFLLTGICTFVGKRRKPKSPYTNGSIS